MNDAPRKLLVVAPSGSVGLPSVERANAFVDMFRRNGIECEIVNSPSGPRQSLGLARKIYREGIKNVFVTMPPFKGWFLTCLPSVRCIVDLRDGWSIAMKSGYGGTVAPAPFKSRIARAIEQFAIRRSALTITCTPGLLDYHTNAGTKEKLLLVLNGFPDTDFDAAMEARRLAEALPPRDTLEFICAGKLSEYGKEKVRDILLAIAEQFPDRDCRFRVFSSDPESNAWVQQFLETRGIKNIAFANNGRIGREELLREIAKSDFGVALVRDTDYEFGTKVFDYIVCGTRIFGEKDDNRNFDRFFGRYFVERASKGEARRYARSARIAEVEQTILQAVK